MKKKWGDTYRKPESIESSVTVEKTVRAEADIKTEVQVESLIPVHDPNYVSSGHVKELTKIFKSMFLLLVMMALLTLDVFFLSSHSFILCKLIALLFLKF